MPETDHDVLTAKTVAMCVLFFCSFTLGTLPIKLSQWFQWKTDAKQHIYVQLLLCMGGGVLLCTTFLHLLPEVNENLEELENFPDFGGLPVAELLMCIGFFIIFFVEECTHFYLHRREQNSSIIRSLRNSIRLSRTEFDEKKLDLEGQHEHFHEKDAHNGHSHMPMDNTSIATIRGLLVVMALSIHELFEGLSVGLESSAATVWYMFGAVSAHKLVIAFCIGVELVSSGMKTFLTVIYVFTFAVVSPIGIGIGLAISEDNGSAAAMPSVVLQGLASGTLLYIVFFEILRGEKQSGIRQYFAILIGFAVMTGITLIEQD